jgi:hypothetical protein
VWYERTQARRTIFIPNHLVSGAASPLFAFGRVRG